MVGTSLSITSMVGQSSDMVDLYRNSAGLRFASRFYGKLSYFGVAVLQKKEIETIERFERSPLTFRTSRHLIVGVKPNLVLRPIFSHGWN